MKGIKKKIADIQYKAKGGEVSGPAYDTNDPNSYLKISPEDKALFSGLTDDQMLTVFGNYAPTIEADSAKLKSLQDNFLSNYKGTPQYYVPNKGFTIKKDYDTYVNSIAPKANASTEATAGAGLLASTSFKPKYPRVGTPEWEANQSIIEAERQKRQYKAEGGIVDGTINADEINRGQKSKKTSKKAGDVAHDIALGTIDLGISTFAPDLIKEKDYNSKYGAHINKTTHGLSSVANNVAEGILHQIFPFTAGLSTGKKAVGSAISGGPDEAISKEQLEQEAAVGTTGRAVGSIVGMEMGKGEDGLMNKIKGGKSTTETETTTVETPTVQETQTVFDPNTLKDSDREAYDAAPDKAAFLKAIGYYDGTYQKMSTGGKVVGPGTAKSDDIPSKLDGGGFVVPAENKAKAEALREKYFGKPKKIASLRGGDQKVMLSNGEHYFTPEEVQVLKANGEDLDALAPNAEVNTDEYKCGGGIKKMAKGGPVGDPIADAMEQIKKKQAKLKSDKEKQDLEDKRNSLASKSSKNRENRDKMKDEAFDKMMKHYNKRLAALGDLKVLNSGKFPKDFQNRLNLTKEERNDISKAQERVLADIKKIENDFLSSKKEYDFVSDSKNYDPVTNELKKDKKKLLSETKNNEKTEKSPYAPESLKTESKTTPSPVKTNGGLGSGVKDAVAPKTTTGTTGGSKTTTKTEAKPVTTTTPTTGGVVAAVTENKTVENTETEDNTPTYEGLENGYFGGDKPAPKKEEVKKKGVLGDGTDIEKAIALGQTAIGVQQLLNDGPRPVDQLDPEFTASVEEAKRDAEFGMSPLERSIAERNMVRQQRGGVRAIVQQSAGNSQQAINSIIALNNEAANNAQMLSLRSEQLLAEKKRYRDALIGQQSAMKKQLFNEKLDAFNIDQQAGANLVGAGISNLIGATRYQKQLDAEKEIAEKKNVTFDPEQLSRILSNTNTPATS